MPNGAEHDKEQASKGMADPLGNALLGLIAGGLAGRIVGATSEAGHVIGAWIDAVFETVSEDHEVVDEPTPEDDSEDEGTDEQDGGARPGGTKFVDPDGSGGPAGGDAGGGVISAEFGEWLEKHAPKETDDGPMPAPVMLKRLGEARAIQRAVSRQRLRLRPRDEAMLAGYAEVLREQLVRTL